MLNRTAKFSNLPFCTFVENVVIPFLFYFTCACFLLIGTKANGQTTFTPDNVCGEVQVTNPEISGEFDLSFVADGKNFRTPVATPKSDYVAPTLWGMAQGVSECCATYLIAPLQKKDGEGKVYRALFLVGYDENDVEILEIMVSDFIFSADRQQASVLQNGNRIDLSNPL